MTASHVKDALFRDYEHPYPSHFARQSQSGYLIESFLRHLGPGRTTDDEQRAIPPHKPVPPVHIEGSKILLERDAALSCWLVLAMQITPVDGHMSGREPFLGQVEVGICASVSRRVIRTGCAVLRTVLEPLVECSARDEAVAFDQPVFALAGAMLVHEYEVAVGHFVVGFGSLSASFIAGGGEPRLHPRWHFRLCSGC